MFYWFYNVITIWNKFKYLNVILSKRFYLFIWNYYVLYSAVLTESPKTIYEDVKYFYFIFYTENENRLLHICIYI